MNKKNLGASDRLAAILELVEKVGIIHLSKKELADFMFAYRDTLTAIHGYSDILVMMVDQVARELAKDARP